MKLATSERARVVALIETVRDANKPISPADRHSLVKLLEARTELDDLVKDSRDYRYSDDLIGKRFRMLLVEPTKCTCNPPGGTPHSEDCPITAHVRALFKQSGEYPS